MRLAIVLAVILAAAGCRCGAAANRAPEATAAASAPPSAPAAVTPLKSNVGAEVPAGDAPAPAAEGAASTDREIAAEDGAPGDAAPAEDAPAHATEGEAQEFDETRIPNGAYVVTDVVWVWNEPIEAWHDRSGARLEAYEREHKVGELTLGTFVVGRGTKGQWREVTSGEVTGWIEADALAPSSEAQWRTVLWRQRVQPGAGSGREEVEVPPGTLIRVLGSRERHGLVPVAVDGSSGWIASCVLSGDVHEVAIAQALAAAARAREEDRAEDAVAVLDAARVEHGSAHLAPLLSGKPPREVACGPPPADVAGTAASAEETAAETADAGPAAPSAAPTRGAGARVVGIWARHGSDLEPPDRYDWRALALAHAGLPPGAPMPARIRADLRAQRVREFGADGETLMGRPVVPFDVPQGHLRGAFYALSSSGFARVDRARLRGELYPRVDCDGCEVGPRSYGGHLELTAPTSPSLIVGFPAAVTFTDGHALTKKAWKTGEGGRSWTLSIPAAGGKTRRLELRAPSDALAAWLGEVTRAYVATVAGSGETLLLVETAGNAVCERGLYLYALDEPVRLLGGRDFECDP